MARTNIKTATISIDACGYSKLPVFASNVLTILSTGRDLYVCCGPAAVEDANSANSFLLPQGAALEMQPVPQGDVFVKTSVTGTISVWYA